ncbi:hypothetical protein M0802_012315 [Mischocyttarus mexicanus]|nr:hypothetical protein M0802_012315 [Mischocyttarus mexicanus]
MDCGRLSWTGLSTISYRKDLSKDHPNQRNDEHYVEQHEKNVLVLIERYENWRLGTLKISLFSYKCPVNFWISETSLIKIGGGGGILGGCLFSGISSSMFEFSTANLLTVGNSLLGCGCSLLYSSSILSFLLLAVEAQRLEEVAICQEGDISDVAISWSNICEKLKSISRC